MTQVFPPMPTAPAGFSRGPVGKQRDGVTVVLLSIITLGIYWLVYVFKTSDEIKVHSGTGIGGVVALVLAIFVGFVTPFLLGNDVRAARVQAGMPERVSALTGFWSWLPLVGMFVYAVKIQRALNEYWAAQGGV